MKKVIILFGKSRWDKSKHFSNEKYQYSYEYFYTLCKENGMQMYRASYQWYDYKNKIFKYAWSFEGKNKKWKRVYNIKPDLIFDKTKATPEAYLRNSIIRKYFQFFNCLEFSKILDNKLATSLLFAKWSKENYLIENFNHLVSFLKKVPQNKKLVLKPINLSGGENVFIGTGVEILKKVKDAKVDIVDWILQDFIDSSAGIPGIMKGIHDLRLVIINDKIIYSYFRKPAPGSLLANLAQGGSMEIVPIKKLPKQIFPIVKKVNNTFSGFSNKIYALDIMFDRKQNPWIIELNSMPGMYFAKGQEKTRRYFYKKLLTVFKNILK